MGDLIKAHIGIRVNIKWTIDMMAKPKRISTTILAGQRGTNLIQGIVLSMGCAYHPTGSLEAGIDGFIELRDPSTGQALNLWIPVQVKARSEFLNETESSFDFICDERDLDYWLKGNVEVILIVCRPVTGEAYWIPVKDY